MFHNNSKFIAGYKVAIIAGCAATMLLAYGSLRAQTPVRVTLGSCGSPHSSEAYVYETVDVPPSFPGEMQP